MQRVWLKFALAICGIVTAALTLAAITVVDDLRTVLRDMTVVRFGLTVNEVKRTIEGGLNLGFGLAEFRQAQTAIDRQQSLDRDILDVIVFNADGVILFASSAGDVGDHVPAVWRDRAYDGQRGIWTVTGSDEGDIVGTYIEDNLGRRVGGIAVRFQGGRAQLVWERLVAALASVGIGVLAVLFPFVAGLCWLAFRPVGRAIDAVAEPLARLGAGETPTTLDADPDAPLFALLTAFNDFLTSYRLSRSTLDQASAELDAADG